MEEKQLKDECLLFAVSYGHVRRLLTTGRLLEAPFCTCAHCIGFL